MARSSRVDIKIGFACNNRCRFCVQGDKRHHASAPTTEAVFAELERASEQASGVVFTGGEPTLRRDLPLLVRRASDLGYSTIQIQSNGRTFASRRYCQTLIDAGATEFSPALHGHLPALHDHLTAAPGSFEQTVRGIRNLRRLHQRVITNSVVVRANVRTLASLARLLVGLGVHQYQLAFVHPVGTAGTNFFSVTPRMALASPYLRQGLAVGRSAGVRCYTEAVPFCILPGYAEHVAEQVIPDTRVVDAGVVVDDYRAYRLHEGKLKGPQCPSCRWFEVCEGPWREYPEHYGFDEFVPVPAQDGGGD